MPRSLSGVEMRKRQAAHIEASPQAPGQPQPNTCCLCWCGCCKCLWNEDRMERGERQTCTKMDNIETVDEQHPSLEEVLSWARSFEMMLHSLEGQKIFREFLRSEYSEDNLLFWLACEELKKETNPSVVDEKARIIYDDYVSILSPKEVPARLLFPGFNSREVGHYERNERERENERKKTLVVHIPKK